MARVGRPTDYTPEIAEDICLKIATHYYGYQRLRKKYPHLPCQETFMKWLRKYPEFVELYLQAKNTQMHLVMDKTLDFACRDEIEEEDGKEDSMVKINRDKLKIDTFKHHAAKLAPKIYGEKASKDDKDKAVSLLATIMDSLDNKNAND